jgi:hypothetical protein
MKASLGLLLFVLPVFAAAEVVVPIDKVENSVNIRLSPDSATEIVGKLKQGDSLPLIKSVPGWHEVEIAAGAAGFISSDWSKVLADAPTTVDATATDEETGGSEVVAESVESDPGTLATASSEKDSEAAAVEQLDVESDDAESAAETITDTEAVVADTVAEAEADTTVAAEEEQPVAAEPVAATAAATTEAEPAAESVPVVPVAGTTLVAGPPGPPGPAGPAGPPGPPGGSSIKGVPDYLMKFTAPTVGGKSQIFDDGNNIGIGTTEPKQRLEVNGSIQIHERNSGVAGLMMTQSSGETGYIMHNRASTLTIGAGSIDRITIDREGNIGIGVARPAHPMEMVSGAHVTAGGVWTNSSSRAKKENIAALTPEEALTALALLQPVQFNYKSDQQETYVGFIAEDVPELVATGDRQGLSAMDIVAVLTKVVQAQQQKIEQLEARLDSGK